MKDRQKLTSLLQGPASVCAFSLATNEDSTVKVDSSDDNKRT